MSETHTLLSAALGKLHCGVLIIDSQRRICFINQWLLQALRHPALDYQDRPLLDVLLDYRILADRVIHGTLADVLADGDLLLVMGAGDIGYVAAELAAHGIKGVTQA